MKLLIQRLAKSNIGIFFRNLIGFRPHRFTQNYKFLNGISISDGFPWRTDNGYKTKFKFSDILGLFYKIENSSVEIVFYSKDNKLIKRIIIEELDYSNELIIDKDFLNGIQSFGTFNIFHRSKGNYEDVILSNRCYVGFSFNNNLSSFVHGNGYVKYKSLDGKKLHSGMVFSSLFTNLYSNPLSSQSLQNLNYFLLIQLLRKLIFLLEKILIT